MVEAPHSEQVTLVSMRPRALVCFALHFLQCLGSCRNCFSQKKACSPALKAYSSPQSTHLRIRSVNSIAYTSLWERPSAIPIRSNAKAKVREARSAALPSGRAQRRRIPTSDRAPHGRRRAQCRADRKATARVSTSHARTGAAIVARPGTTRSSSAAAVFPALPSVHRRQSRWRSVS